MDDTDELGKALTDRILELSRQVEELERILGSGLAADEAAFAQALRERTQRFRVELEEAHALVRAADRADPACAGKRRAPKPKCPTRDGRTTEGTRRCCRAP